MSAFYGVPEGDETPLFNSSSIKPTPYVEPVDDPKTFCGPDRELREFERSEPAPSQVTTLLDAEAAARLAEWV